MRRVVLFCVFTLCFSASASAQPTASSRKHGTLPIAKPAPSPAAMRAARASFEKLPLAFEENQGQTDRRVKFLSRGAGYNLFLTADQAVIAVRGSAPSASTKGAPEGAALWLKMLGANPSAQISGSDVLPGTINYYVGKDPSKWRTGVRQFAKVSYRGIYPGVDLTYYGNQQQLESDFIVAPGADPQAIEFEVAGARETRLDAQGNLVLATNVGYVQLLRPGVYQTINGVRHDVTGRYVLRADNRVGFEIGKYDPSQALIIDPTLIYATYLGGSALSTGDTAYAIAIDASGDAYVTGQGTSADFPGADQNGPVVLSLSEFAFVTEFNPTGSSNGASLVYSTILSGSTDPYNTSGNGIGVDGNGFAYIAGVTEATDFPMVNPYQSSYGAADETGFVAGLKSDGTLIYSTYLGGLNYSDETQLNGIYADASGNAYVVGDTTSANFPTVNPYQSTLTGYQNVVVAEFSNQGQPTWSTYLGGNTYDYGFAITADSSHNAYVTGYTDSTNFPLQTSPAPFQSTNKGSYNLFVSKLAFNGSGPSLTLANSTYLGGSGTDYGYGIAVDTASPPNVYLTGETTSSGTSGFPTQNPIYGTFGGASDAFVSKLNPTFSALVFSTFLGGSGSDIGHSIALDAANPPNVFVAGSTASTNFPTSVPLQSVLGSSSATNAFITEVNSGGTALTYSTYMGGIGIDQAYGIAVDASDNAYVAGKTTSPNFPVLSGGPAGTKPYEQYLHSTSGNAFVAKISPTTASALNLFPPIFNFETIALGAQSAAEQITLSNNTASAVIINTGGISIGGTNPGDFAQINNCPVAPAAIAAGASCVISVTFTPMDQDVRTATLNVASSGPSASMTLSGIGGVPEASFSTTSLNFGSEPLNVQTSETITVTNTGGGNLQVGSAQIQASANSAMFSVIPNESTCFLVQVTPNSSCYIYVSFTPTAAGSNFTANLLVTTNTAGSPQAISLTGSGVQEVLVSPTSISFFPNVVGSTSLTSAGEAELTNGSGGTITVTETPGAGADQGDFHVYTTNSIDTCSTVGQLAAGGSCRLALYFQPLAAGARTGTYTLAWSGAATGSQPVTLTGTGETGVSLYTNSITAPSEYVGVSESSAGLEYIFNGTSNPVTITTTIIGNNPGDFSSTLSSSCAPNNVIPAQTECPVTLSFKPSALGLRTATANYDYTGDDGVPLVLTATGTGIPGPVQFPSSYNFGTEIQGTTTPTKAFEFRNISTVPVTISSIAAPANADFAITSDTTCSASTIPAGGSCFIFLKFTPSTTSAETGSLVVTDAFATGVGADPSSPHTLALSGTGETSGITVSVSSGGASLLDFGNVQINPTTIPQAEIFLTNAGNSSTTISWPIPPNTTPAPALLTTGTAFSLVATGPNVTTCTQGKVVLPQGGSCLIGIAFDPTTSGEQFNSLTFTDSTSGTAHTVQIQGKAVSVAKIQFSPTSLTFNQVPTAPPTAGPAQTVTLTNSSTVATGAPLTITSILLAGTNTSSFALPTPGSGTPCTVGLSLAPTASCVFSVTFTAPTSSGYNYADLEVTTNLGNNTTSTNYVTLTGDSLTGGFMLTPAAPIVFGTVAVGNTASSTYYLLTNENPASVVFGTGSIVVPTGYSIGYDGCSGNTLATGSECEFLINFAPTGASSYNGNLQISYTGASGSPYLVALQGSGVAAVVANPNPVNLGSVSPGSQGSSSLSIQNGTTSTATITSVSTPVASTGFAISYNGCTTGTLLSGVGSSCPIYVTYTPPTGAALGNTSTTFTVGYSVGSVAQTPITVTLQATVYGAQAVVTTPASGATLMFPSQTVNTSGQVVNVVVQNGASASATLYFSSFKITGNDFSLATYSTGNCQYASLNAGQSCTIPIVFTPTAAGTRNGTLTITDNSSPTTQTVLLQGVGLGGTVSVSPTTLTFPQTNVGSSVTLGATVSNTTGSVVTINSIAYTGPFSADTGTGACGASLGAVTGTCEVYTKFTPTGGGNTSGTATITYNGTSTLVIVLNGAGFNPIVNASPNPLTFSAQAIGTSSGPLTVTLSNPTSTSVTVTGTPSITGTNPGDFSLGTNSCTNGFVLVASTGSCTVNVIFTPGTNGGLSRTAILSIPANDPNAPHTVALNGTATEPVATLSTGTLAFGNSNVNVTTAPMTVSLSNTGTAALTGLSTALGGAGFAFATPTGTDCRSVTSLAPSASCSVAITFTPTSTTGFSGTITFADSANPSTQIVNLSGTGTQPSTTFNPSTVAFGNQLLNATSTQMTATLNNTGTGPLTISNVVLAGSNPSDFTLVTPTSGSDCRTIGTVGAGASCTVAATFTPTALGSLSATVTVTDNASPTTQQVTLTGVGAFPQATPTPSPVAFGNQMENVTSAVQTLTLSNGGTAPLQLTSVALGGTNPAAFAIASGTTCTNGSSVPAGSSCVVNLTFTPTALTGYSATVTFTDNANPTTQVVNLSGTGVFPQASAGPTTVPFGNQILSVTSSAQTITLSNAGTGPLLITTIALGGTNPGDFAFSSGTTCTNGGTVAAGSSCIVSVTFTPAALGSRSATVTFTDDASPTTQSVSLTGTGVFPQASPAPTTIAFGNETNGATTAPQTITLSNAGTATLNLTTVALGGTNPSAFALASGTTCTNGGTVAAGSSCIVKVTFTPNALGALSATVTFTDNASPTTQVVNLSGTGVTSTVTFNPGAVAFGNQLENTTSAQMSSVLTNSGSTTLTISGVTLTGANPTDFAFVTPTSGTDCRTIGTVPVLGTCTIAATFTPLAVGSLDATVSVADNAPGSPHTFQLTGMGTFPQATPTPNPVAFGNQRENATSPVQVLTLTNGGTATLNLTTVVLGGTNANQFAIATGTTCTNGSTVAAGASCIVNLTFTPTALGAQAATVTFTDNASPTTQVVNLTGTGVFPQATPAPATVPFGNQRENATSAAQTITLTNGGTGVLNLTTVALGGTDPGDYSIVAGTTTCVNGGTVAASGSCVVNVTFTPTALGSRPATVVFTDNASPTTQTVNLTGTGVFPQASPAPATVPFGNQTNGTTSLAQTITLSNAGTGTLNLTTVALGGTNPGAFAIASGTTCVNGGTVAAGSSCIVNVTFTPNALGALSATVTFTDDASPTTQVVNLTGTGVTSTVNFSPTTVAFGNQLENTTSAQMSSVLTNSGSTALTISTVTLTGANPTDFAFVTPSSGTDCRTIGTVPAAGTCTIAATFTPVALGSLTASVSVADSANGSPHTFQLTGMGTFPQATPTPNPVAFGNQRENATSPVQVLTLTNGGTATLNLTTVVLGGTNASQFAIATGTTCTNGSTVAAGASCIVNLTFTPTALGAQAATVTFTDNASPTTQVVNLTGTGVFPQATPAPTTVPFGNQRENATSAAQTITLNNGGTGPLTLTTVALGGTDPGDYSIVAGTTTCVNGGTVAAGSSCVVNVTFTPTALGSRPATVVFTDNASPTTQTVNLTGTGVFPQASPAPATVPFGNQTNGTTSLAQTITLSNAGTGTLNLTTVALGGTNPGAFAIASGTTCVNGGTVAAGSSCVVNVTFTPSGLTAFSATVTFTDDASPTTQVVNLTGTGVTSTVNFSPTTVAFGNQRTNTTSAQMTSVLTNSGAGTLTISSVTLTGANPTDFAFVTPTSGSDCRTIGTVPAAGTCTIAATFTPLAVGSLTATVAVADSANGSPHTFQLTGTGTFPQATPTPSPLAFANQIQSTTSTAQTITLTNGGTDPLHLTTVALGGTNSADFSIVAGTTTCTNGSTVAPGASCGVNVTFTPATANAFSATITFTDDASPTTQVVNLTGTGVTPPTATPAPTTLAFGNQRVSSASAAQPVTITNSGGAPLNITGIAFTGTNPGDFAFASPATTCPTAGGTVAANSSCTLSVTFDPAATGARSATITLTDNANATGAPGSTQTITLTGTGIAPLAASAPTSETFAAQEVSTSSTALSGTLNNTGTDVLHVTAVAITGANAGDFSIVAAGTSCETGLPTPVSVAASANCTWSVLFTPTAIGTRTATLTFTDDSNAVTGSTQTVTLTGTGTAPVVVLAPTTVTFPAQAIGTTSAALSGTLTNTGTTALHISNVAITGPNAADFAIATGTTCTSTTVVAATSGVCNWAVTFTPSANGTRTATLTFTDDNNGVSGSTETVPLSGVTPASASLTPSPLPAFGNQGVGTTSSTAVVTVTNPGGSPLVLSGVALSGTNPGDFAIASGTTCTSTTTVQPNATCTINLTFTPTTAGTRAATLTVTDNANPTTQTLALSGTAIDFTLAIPTPPAAATAGQPIMATIQITPGANGFPNPITFAASNLPPDSTGSFSTNTLTSVTSQTTVTFTLMTTARSGSAPPRPSLPAKRPPAMLWLTAAVLALLGIVTLRRGVRSPQRLAYLPLAVLLLSAAIVTGCTSGSTATGTPAGTYNVTVTATSGAVVRTTTISVTVQ